MKNWVGEGVVLFLSFFGNIKDWKGWVKMNLNEVCVLSII